jgi:phosphoketolase
MVANTWLEGTYSELYPSISQNAEGMRRLFRQFSFPGGIPSHAAPETPGSINEGSEFGYSLSHAYGAALDNPGLIVACVIGDGEAETGPLATSWHGNKFLNPATDGAVLPILRSSTLTATRSPTRRSSPASRASSSKTYSSATTTSRISSKATTRRRCTS